ncbi:MAG: hypothetical protein HC769_18350 [Cyanobacteria bacterium CRU_2_1]|nr:hypothetical protein [Cyanobacteria bacterium RU_5_0]NJR60617.1 hypothetical protein [Cyanobacteria bacterium CRU_2_1]
MSSFCNFDAPNSPPSHKDTQRSSYLWMSSWFRMACVAVVLAARRSTPLSHHHDH